MFGLQALEKTLSSSHVCFTARDLSRWLNCSFPRYGKTFNLLNVFLNIQLSVSFLSSYSVFNEHLNKLIRSLFKYIFRYCRSCICEAPPTIQLMRKSVFPSFLAILFIRLAQSTSYLKRSLLVGPSGLEPPTSCLSGTRSNLLSYEPMWLVWIFAHLACNSLSVRSFLPIHFSLLPFTSDVGKHYCFPRLCRH